MIECFQLALAKICLWSAALLLSVLVGWKSLKCLAWILPLIERKPVRVVVFGVVVSLGGLCVCISYGGSKTNAPPCGAANPPRLMAGPGAPMVSSPPTVIVPSSEDGFGPWTNTVTSLMLTGVSCASSSLVLRASWPQGDTVIPGSFIDFFATDDLRTNVWEWIARVPVPAATTNLVAEIPLALFPGDGHGASVRAGTSVDSDGDGETDLYETLVSLHNPRRNDSDADGDGLSLADELGAAYVLPDGFLWFDVTNGPNLVRSDNTLGNESVMLANGLLVDGVRYGSAILSADGFTHLYPESGYSGWYWNWRGQNAVAPLEFATDDFSGDGAVTIAGCDADMYVRKTAWGSGEYAGTVTTNGAAYDVVEFLNLGLHACRTSAESPLLSYELIIPHDEPGVVYVSYGRVDEGIRALDMVLGIQCACRRDPLATNEFFTLMSPVAGSDLVAGTTIRYELGTGTDPTSSDTDGDGVPDGLDPFPLDVSGAICGQGEEWVRANFTNAEEILSVGYADWVDAQVGSGLENGLYRLTVGVPSVPSSPVLFSVGELSVVVTNAGEYVFVLEKGVGYPLFVSSPEADGFTWTAVDDLPDVQAPQPTLSSGETQWTIAGGDLRLIAPFWSAAGYLRWNPWLQGSPGISRLGPVQTRCTFRANLVDYRYAQSAVFSWSGGDADVCILSPHDQETVVEVVQMPSWRSLRLSVSVDIFGETLTSVLEGLIVGEHDTPQIHLGLDVPQAVFLNEADSPDLLRLMTLSCSSDAPTNGTYVLTCSTTGGLVRMWDSPNRSRVEDYTHAWPAAEPCAYAAYLEGIEKSRSLGDVTFRLEYRDAAGVTRASVEKPLTVIKVGNVILPGEPEGGLVVLRGTSVAMEVECEPADAGMFLSTSWQTRRLKCDGSYSNWDFAAVNTYGNTALYTPATGGIYQVRSYVSLQGVTGASVERCFVWSEDEDRNIGVKERGDARAFGVCDENWQVALRSRAFNEIGSQAYSRWVAVEARGPYLGCWIGDWKCNMFVAHMIYDVEYTAGIFCPVLHTATDRGYPPLANEWATGHIFIPGWRHLDDSEFVQPGFVVGHYNPVDSGHCGIVDFDGWGIAAGANTVNRLFPEWEVTCGYNTYNGLIDE